MFEAVLTNNILQRILKIEENKIRVINIDIPSSNINNFKKIAKMKSIYFSNLKENNKYTQEQVEEIINSENIKLTKAKKEIISYYNALNLLEKRVNEKVQISLNLILEIIGKIETNIKENSDCLSLLVQLVEYVNNSDDHPLITIALVHYQLVTSHYFNEENNKIAILISKYLLGYYGYDFNNLSSLEECFTLNIDRYHDLLLSCNEKSWVNYFIEIIEMYSNESLNLLLSLINSIIKESISSLNKKEILFLKYTLINNINNITPSKLSTKLNVTNRTIINWCNKLITNELLVPNLINNKVKFYSIPEFLKNNKQEIINILN